MMFWYSAALLSWSLALMVVARNGPSKLPLGVLTLALPTVDAQIVDVEAVCRERLKIGDDAHGGALAARQADQTDAGQLRYFLRQARVGQIFDLRQRQSFRCHRQSQHRRIGGIDLGVNRRRGQIGGQQVARRVDGGLHFLFGDVETEAEVELQCQQPMRPPQLIDDIWLRPGICPNCRSSGAVTAEVITSGLAPG